MAALLATTDSGSLAISDTRDGLDYTLECPNTSRGNDTLELIDSGLISGSSIEMIVRSDHFEYGGAGVPTRHLDEVQLRSISPVSTPAYPDATTARRSLDLASQSFARQFDADEDEVRYDLENGNAARYFTRTDLQVAVPVPPTPLDVASGALVEARSAQPSSDGGLDIKRRLLALRKRKMDAELTPLQRAAQEYRETTADLTTRQARLRSSQTGLDVVESRSVVRQLVRHRRGALAPRRA